MQQDKQNVLVIDDDVTVRKVIAFHLKKNSYNVFEAESADLGMNLLESEKIDLVLCDVSMKEMDGFTFCRKVRENNKYKILPFIFVTAKSSLEDKSKALDAGGDDIITKPFDVQELLLKVKGLLRRSEIYKVYGTKKNLEESFNKSQSKVLIVDDDLSLAKLFQYNLSKAGFDCSVAEGAEEGIQLAKSLMPDIIVSDIMMPKIDGFAFRRLLLADQDLKSIPFIFLTSKGEENDILEGYDLGIADYVLKTAGPRVVVAKVTAIVKSLGKERERIVSELHQAADSLRIKVVPDNKPDFEGFEIEHWHQTFQGIPGGDFIDYVSLNEDNIAIILGDVMGKKWGAWYFALAYAGYVRSAIRVVLQTTSDYSPKEILQQVNQSVYKDAKVSEVFATLSIVILNGKTKTAKYSGAGDLPILLKKSLTGEVEKISSRGKLLGFRPDGGFEDQLISLSPNDSIVLLTDGVIESRNKDGEQFGLDNLTSIMQNTNSEKSLLNSIKKEFSTFTLDNYEDDISLITIKAN